MTCIYCGRPTQDGRDEHAECVEESILAGSLREAEARYQRAFRRSEETREQRNAAVLAAIEAGWTHAQIANATGLTRARIGQIALTR